VDVHPLRSAVANIRDVFLEESPLLFIPNVSKKIAYVPPSGLYSILCYYIFCSEANVYAGVWWEGNYA
jgi:hypothetical protein